LKNNIHPRILPSIKWDIKAPSGSPTQERAIARYEVIDTSPRFLAMALGKQLLPGSFEYAVHQLLDHEFDLSLFDGRYRNDRDGASAYSLLRGACQVVYDFRM
jgi:hypothetical protein